MRAATIKRWLRDDVTLSQPTSVDEYGQPTSTSGSVRAHVRRKHTRSRDANGQEFTSTTQVLLDTPIRVGDTLTIDGEERVVRSVQASAGVRGGVTLYEAML